MKIKLVGKNLSDIRPLLAEAGLIESERDFELVVTHGGDGALLTAERDYPGVPKLSLRDAATAPVCPAHGHREQLADFIAGKLELSKLPKLKADFGDGVVKAYAVNDIFVHNADRGSALRYRVKIDGELYAEEIVGDGAGLSSVHGSTAYYRSITHSVFRVGLGLAFSNSTVEVSHLVLKESSQVEFEIIRGPALAIADNYVLDATLPIGGKITLAQSDQVALVYGLANFMCPRCRFLRHVKK